MATSCRSWWRNCALQPDAEISSIDEMEDAIAPIDDNTHTIRELISSLELCHHKAERWIHNIVEAIGAGNTSKGLGTRSPESKHPNEILWQDAYAALSAWCAGSPASEIDLIIDEIPAAQLLGALGERSALKEWQVQRVVEKIRSYIHWPLSYNNPATRYAWLMLSAGDYEFAYLDHCPEHFKEHEDFWLTTAQTIIQDRENGAKAKLSLAIAIDMLWPCHWAFVDNLHIVLGAIGGDLNPDKPFAACGRNIGLTPIRRRMDAVCNTLKCFCGEPGAKEKIDQDLLILLGELSDTRKWLAASLDKTIRLQLDPPAELRAISSLTGPEWIQHKKPVTP